MYHHKGYDRYDPGKELCQRNGGPGEMLVHIKVVILLFNAFQWFVKRLNPIASLDFNYEQL